MRIGVPQATKPGENRVAVTTTGVRALRESGVRVVVETGAGVASGFEDRGYRAAGGTIVSTAAEDGPPTSEILHTVHLSAPLAIPAVVCNEGCCWRVPF